MQNWLFHTIFLKKEIYAPNIGLIFVYTYAEKTTLSEALRSNSQSRKNCLNRQFRGNSFRPLGGWKSPAINVTSAAEGDIASPSACQIESNTHVTTGGPFIGFERTRSPTLEQSFRPANHIREK